MDECECGWPSVANGRVGWLLDIVWSFYACPTTLSLFQFSSCHPQKIPSKQEKQNRLFFSLWFLHLISETFCCSICFVNMLTISSCVRIAFIQRCTNWPLPRFTIHIDPGWPRFRLDSNNFDNISKWIQIHDWQTGGSNPVIFNSWFDLSCWPPLWINKFSTSYNEMDFFKFKSITREFRRDSTMCNWLTADTNSRLTASLGSWALIQLF